MLSKTELSGYGSGTLTSVFLERLYAECITYDGGLWRWNIWTLLLLLIYLRNHLFRTRTGEMDYKTYLDFVLALENRQEPQSLQYLFRILDLDHQGYLTSFTLNYFFKVRLASAYAQWIWWRKSKPQHSNDFRFKTKFSRAFKNKSKHTEPKRFISTMSRMKYLTWLNQKIPQKSHSKISLTVDKAKQWSPYSSNSTNFGHMKIVKQWLSTQILKSINQYFEHELAKHK